MGGHVKCEVCIDCLDLFVGLVVGVLFCCFWFGFVVLLFSDCLYVCMLLQGWLGWCCVLVVLFGGYCCFCFVVCG